MTAQKINTFLWFDTQAEEAANFYVSLFKNSSVKNVTRYPAEGEEVTGRPPGTVMTVTFVLDGQEFVALNGGPQFKFNEAISLLVKCDGQAEIDRLWNALTADGGEESMCGWLKDKYGLSWQVVPKGLGEMLSSPAAVQAMMKMRKFDIAALKAA